MASRVQTGLQFHPHWFILIAFARQRPGPQWIWSRRGKGWLPCQADQASSGKIKKYIDEIPGIFGKLQIWSRRVSRVTAGNPRKKQRKQYSGEAGGRRVKPKQIPKNLEKISKLERDPGNVIILTNIPSIWSDPISIRSCFKQMVRLERVVAFYFDYWDQNDCIPGYFIVIMLL